MAQSLGLPSDRLLLLTDRPLPVVQRALRQAAAGLHTMWNEHFGISVVEMQAAALLPVANDSGGPRSDIVQPGRTGYLATSPEQYAACLLQLLEARELYPQRLRRMQRLAMRSARRFCDEAFAARWAHEATLLLQGL